MTMPADVKAYNQRLIAEFRAAGGPPEGRNILLLTTTGARSGHPHTTPMMFIEEQGELLVIASNAGATRHPDWFANLVAHPEVTVEKGSERYQARADVPHGAERDRWWAVVTQRYPFFAEHQAKVSRAIPVVVLVRLA
jgi:deazaflavin-dependent oxidoreductase (nitroreductase family)